MKSTLKKSKKKKIHQKQQKQTKIPQTLKASQILFRKEKGGGCFL